MAVSCNTAAGLYGKDATNGTGCAKIQCSISIYIIENRCTTDGSVAKEINGTCAACGCKCAIVDKTAAGSNVQVICSRHCKDAAGIYIHCTSNSIG